MIAPVPIYLCQIGVDNSRKQFIAMDSALKLFTGFILMFSAASKGGFVHQK